MERITVFDGEFWAHKNFPPVKDDNGLCRKIRHDGRRLRYKGYPLNDDRCAGCPLDGHCEFVKCWKKEGMQNVLDKQDKG